MVDCMVSILCTTYNQEPYIKDALDGFLMQKTSFPFEVIVHDDASTDGARGILEDYEARFDNVKVVYEEVNKYDQRPRGGYFQGLMEKFATGKYIALCEGDDFWTDENKLQSQFDYMESNPDCICCGHATIMANADDTDHVLGILGCGDKEADISSDIVLSSVGMHTSSLFYKRGLAEKYLEEWCLPNVIGDIPWLVWLCENGRVHYIPAKSSVYRVMAKGSYSAVKDPDMLAQRNADLIKLFTLLDGYTNGKYSKIISMKNADYAYRGAAWAGMSFLSPGMPGYEFKKEISFCRRAKLLVWMAYRKVRGLKDGSFVF